VKEAAYTGSLAVKTVAKDVGEVQVAKDWIIRGFAKAGVRWTRSAGGLALYTVIHILKRQHITQLKAELIWFLGGCAQGRQKRHAVPPLSSGIWASGYWEWVCVRTVAGCCGSGYVYLLLTRGVSKLPNTVRHRTRTTPLTPRHWTLHTDKPSPTGAAPGGLGGAGRLELELDAQHAVAVRL
jgi:hypothetical protein